MMNPEKIPFKNEDDKQTFSDIQELKEIINHQQTHTPRSAKGSPSGRRNMTSDENINLNKGMRNTGNSDCRGK